MEYTYQPPGTTGVSRLFSRSTAASATKSAKNTGVSDVPVREVVLGRSLLARLGYWLLMRNAIAAKPSHNKVKCGKNPKVTCSELRQNRLPEHVLSIAASNGRKKLVRIANGKTERVSGGSGHQKSARGSSNLANGIPTRKKRVVVGEKLETSDTGLGVSQLKTAGKKPLVHRKKNFEQDQFVKTERNIAAAMKEAQRGISAEQLVIRFGLSVPEAGLITSMYK